MSVVSPIVGPVVKAVISHVIAGGDSVAPEPDSLLTDLVAWWSLDEASGTRVNAHNPGTHDLTDNNTVGSTAGVVGNAAVFVAASNEYLSLAHHADFVMGDRDFTVAGWAKFGSGSDIAATIIAKGEILSTSDGWNVQRFSTTESVRLEVRNTTDSAFVQTATRAIVYDTWFLFIAAYDAAADQISLSVNNGTPVTASLVGGSFAGDTQNLYLGGSPAASRDMNGADDEVAVWHRLLTTEEKDRLYNAGAGMGYPG